MILGSIALKASVLAAALALVSALRWARGVRSAERTFRLAYHAMTACLVVASIHLLVMLLGHDFRFEYVLGYTSRDLPTLYLLSAFWAGQSGTFLLWALFAALKDRYSGAPWPEWPDPIRRRFQRGLRTGSRARRARRARPRAPRRMRR